MRTRANTHASRRKRAFWSSRVASRCIGIYTPREDGAWSPAAPATLCPDQDVCCRRGRNSSPRAQAGTHASHRARRTSRLGCMERCIRPERVRPARRDDTKEVHGEPSLYMRVCVHLCVCVRACVHVHEEDGARMQPTPMGVAPPPTTRSHAWRSRAAVGGHSLHIKFHYCMHSLIT